MFSGTGDVSMTRTCIAVTFAFIVGVGTALAFKIGRPITVAEYCAFLGAAATFIASVCAPLYLINRGADVASKKLSQSTPEVTTTSSE